ncbi:MAG: hypothetical protein BRC48_16920 [Cyanobacteria bacterium QS_9_48_30]|nr:MAG: hypothetical protein BRC48_16920 [Cyanobacteria bacterium QS_9_48_30]
MLINRINLIKPLYSRLPPGLCGLLTSCYCVSLKTFDFSDRKDYRLEKIAIIVLTLSAIDRVQNSSLRPRWAGILGTTIAILTLTLPPLVIAYYSSTGSAGMLLQTTYPLQRTEN